ncbi:MAG TPA: SIMPL domain-containing protein [Thermoanaerobaculia bacterium]|nr:SIMPL domain-containing protein [Thermoanaerobaculia bacterium]
MKRFLPVFLIVTAAASVFAQPVPALAPRDPGLPETISVSGNGKSNVTPDRFTFTVGVQTVANTVDEAVTQNNKRVAAVIAALKAAGARDQDIQTSNFNIWPQQDYQEGRLPRILGYQVTNNVTVRSAKVADAGRLLGVGIGAGVNTSSGINFEVSDPARGRDQGLSAAFDDARAKAALLAKAAGRSLGPVIYISEGVQMSQQPPYPMQRAMAMEARAASADVPVESGSQELSYAVTVTFRLQ